MGERPGAVTEWPAWLLERFHPEHEPGTKRPPMTDTPARAALMAAGYRYHGSGRFLAGYDGATLYQRREGDIALTVAEWPPNLERDVYAYELDVYHSGGRDAAVIKLYSYTADQLAANLPELERRALAMMRAGVEG